MELVGEFYFLLLVHSKSQLYSKSIRELYLFLCGLMLGEWQGLLYILGEDWLGPAFFDASELIDSSIFH